MIKNFRLWLPALMVVAAIFLLRAIDREQREWRALDAAEAPKQGDDFSAGSVIRLLPLQHSSFIQDGLTIQWPATIGASFFAPVARLHYYNGEPAPPTPISYLCLTAAVAGYWFLIGFWIDTRLLRMPLRRHRAVARVVLIVAAVCTIPYFLLFLSKDLVGGWRHGPQGAYGFTAWLALVCLIVLTELGVFRRTA